MALRTKDGRADKGISLARGPALVLGSILLTFGLILFLTDGTSPTDGFPDGTIDEFETFLGFDVNDWTALITAAAGGLLLFGAAQHLLAKTMSLLVGLALGACAVIALVDGDDVLGLAAANGAVALGWGIASAILLINALLPRKGGRDKRADHDDIDRDRTLDADRDRPMAPPRRETVHREERVVPTAAAPLDRDRTEPRRDLDDDRTTTHVTPPLDHDRTEPRRDLDDDRTATHATPPLDHDDRTDPRGGLDDDRTATHVTPPLDHDRTEPRRDTFDDSAPGTRRQGGLLGRLRRDSDGDGVPGGQGDDRVRN